MTFSDALPVQFWLASQETYNEKEPQGVFRKCFCQPWKCDDEIRIEFLDSLAGHGISTVTLPDLDEWIGLSTSASLENWTTGAAPTVSLPGTGFPNDKTSELLYVDYTFIAGREYEITIQYTKTVNVTHSNPRTITIHILNSAFTTLFSNSDSTPNTTSSDAVTITFTATAACTKIGVTCNDGSDVDITLNSHFGTVENTTGYDFVVLDSNGEDLHTIEMPAVQLESGTYLHYLTYRFSDYSPDVCDEQVNFEIRNLGTVVAKSDCLNVRSTQDETVLITYSDNKNFASLQYSNVSPDPEFTLRIPAVFFHERFPEESEVIELSNSRSIQLNGQVKAQRLLEIGPMPYYMHRKLKLILKHQFVTIDDQDWVQSETYELTEGNRRHPLKKGQVWLDEKDYILRNVL